MLAQTVTPRFKATIIKQQTIGGTSAQLTLFTLADVLANTAMAPVNGVIPNPDNIVVKAAPGNSGTVTIMPVNPAVSLGAGDILSAGGSVTLPVNQLGLYYIIGSAASQVVNIHYQFGQIV